MRPAEELRHLNKNPERKTKQKQVEENKKTDSKGG
jgi:hypothetical protein